MVCFDTLAVCIFKIQAEKVPSSFLWLPHECSVLELLLSVMFLIIIIFADFHLKIGLCSYK